MFKDKYLQYLSLPLAERVGLFGLFGWALFAWESNIKGLIAFIVLVAGCLLDRRFWITLKDSRIAQVVALLAAYIIVRGVFAAQENPEFASRHAEDGGKLLWLAGFLCVGWLLRDGGRRVYWTLGIAVTGFWIGRMEHMDFVAMFTDPSWWQTRHRFSLGSEIAFGQYSAASLIGLLLMLPHLWSRPWLPWQRGIVLTGWTWLTFLSVQGIVTSQARGPWVALMIVTPLIIFAKRRTLHRIGLLPTMIVLGLILGILGAAFSQSPLLQRFVEEADTNQAILSGNFEDIRATNERGHIKSLGVRFHMIAFGIEHWQKNPVFGLGPGITKPLIKSEWTASRTYSDLHNAYIEMLLRLGIVGTGLITLVLLLLLRDSFRALGAGLAERDLVILVAAALALHLLVAIANFRMLNNDWRYYWFLFGGIAFAWSLRLNRGNP